MNTIPTPRTEAFLNGMNGTSAGRAVKRWYQFTKDMERELIRLSVEYGRSLAEIMDERDEARQQAEIERDKHCHPDHGGHLFSWENDERIRAGKEH